MKKRAIRKLRLQRETLHNLQSGLSAVAGGGTETCSDDCKEISYCMCPAPTWDVTCSCAGCIG